MKKILICFLFLYAVLSCTNKNEQFDPNQSLTKAQQDSVLLDFAIYTDEHTPDSINAANRFEEKNKAFFETLTSKYAFKYLTKDGEDGQYKYFVYKSARGTDDYFVGMGGTFKLSSKNKITALTETFRMWRMSKAELDKKGLEVYEKFVDNKPLDEYTNSEEKQYIEFPNDHVAYDPEKHEWKIVKLYN